MRISCCLLFTSMAIASISAAQHGLPLIVTGPVHAAADRPTGPMAWRAWSEASPSVIVESAAGEAVGLARADGFWGDIGRVADAPAGSWLVVIEGAGHFAVARASVASALTSFPAVTLVALPSPVAAASETGVQVTWTPVGADGLVGWSLERSLDGRTFAEIAHVDPAAGAWNDTSSPASALYALRAVFAGGVPGRETSTRAAVGHDADGDGMPDAFDRCRMFADPEQVDTDGDGITDACDFRFGDVAPVGRPDGALSLGDVVRLLRFSVGLEQPSAPELRAGDIAPAAGPALALMPAPDGSIDVDDAVLALRALVGSVVLAEPR